MKRHARRAAGGGAVAIVLAVAGVAALTAQTLDELLARHFQTRGGLDRLRALQTIKITGTITSGGQQASIVTWLVRPNLVRQEMQIQGRSVIQAFDGERAWFINPLIGIDTARELPKVKVDLMKSQADFDGPLVDYQVKGTALEIIGPDTVDGAKVIKLKITRKAGPPQFLYLDAATGIQRKLSTEVEQDGQRHQVDLVMGDYREVSGILVPFLTETFVDGQLQTRVVVQSVEFDVPVDRALFSMPRR